MTVVLAVDLASKLSAVILRGAAGEVLHQFDSRNKSALEFCKEVANAATSADLIVVEDAPYGLAANLGLKPILRLQGALCAYLTAKNRLDYTIFMIPSTWMRDFPGVQQATTRGLTKAAADQERIDNAAAHAQRCGYTPPDLVGDWEQQCRESGKKVLKKDTAVLAKSQTDYVSAFLISEYARQFTQDQLLAMPGVQQAIL